MGESKSEQTVTIEIHGGGVSVFVVQPCNTHSGEVKGEAIEPTTEPAPLVSDDDPVCVPRVCIRNWQRALECASEDLANGRHDNAAGYLKPIILDLADLSMAEMNPDAWPRVSEAASREAAE